MVANARGNSARKRANTLSRYRAKRDFHKSPEPAGRVHAGDKARVYCIQKHLASHLHYDFRLESDGVLLSWAVPKGPSLRTRDRRLAMRVEDHPYDYKDFEGVIPSGYGAGVVMLWDTGTWEPEPGFENVRAAIAKGELKFRVNGVKLKGAWVLVRTGARTDSGERETWLLIKHRDEWSGDVDVAKVAPRSVKSDRSFEEILKGNPEVWESNRGGGMDLEKIAAKVAALGEGPGRKMPPQRRGRVSRKRTADRRPAKRKPGSM